MRKSFSNIRYGISAITHSLRFSRKITHSAYRKYIGHDKIIAWHKGCPMFTTFSPPSFGDVFANKIANSILSNIKNRPMPHIADIAVTDRCNSNCVHCSFFIDSKRTTSYKKSEVLSTSELKRLIDDCLDLGVTSINIVGGEPLMREDIIEIIQHIDKESAICSIFTNGWFLKENASRLKKAGLTSVKVSIDSADPKRHDSLRNHEGLFARAIDGIKEARRQGIITAISCCITKKETEDGSLVKIIELGRKLGVNEVIVFDALPAGKYSHRDDLLNDVIDVDRLMEAVRPYNESSLYPGIFVYSYVRSHRSMGCAGGTSYFYISPYGDMSPCDFNHMNIGNIRKEPLHILWHKLCTRSSASSCDGCALFSKQKK